MATKKGSILQKMPKISTDGLLPAALGAVGVVYYAMQANAPTPSPSSPGYEKQLGEWTKHVQTGQIFAVVALGTGILISRFRKKPAEIQGR